MSWTPQEDGIVRKAVMKYGTNQWNRVASLLKRHRAADCRQRWFDVLNPKLKHSEWTPLEDRDLQLLAVQSPNMWRSIGAALGRSGEECHKRFLQLQGTEKIESKEEIEEDKAELVAANARLSSSMGRKAKRKQRERAEQEEKFLNAVEEHRRTGKPLNERDFARPGIAVEVPVEDHDEERTGIVLGKAAGPPRKLNKGRPTLVLSKVAIPEVPPTSNAIREEVEKLLADLPPPRNEQPRANIDAFIY